jgi:RNA 2',3'-cyclic 3'-phosphodiesterase
VAKERLGSPRARLFAALDLPDRVREALAAWQRRELTDPALRAVAPQALHVTLCFLGYHPERAIERIAAEVEGLAPRAVELRFEPQPVGVPENRPRLFAADAPSEATVELQAELSARLEANGFYRPEKREFWSHVTVARARPERGEKGPSGRRRRGHPRAIESPPGPLPEAVLDPFFGVRVTLYRSHLRPAGAEYAPLAGFDLPPG